MQIFDMHQLRQKIEEKLEIPFDNTDSYIAYHHVDDEQEENEPHFSIIWTSKKLLARISDELTQDDATYRLTWQGYPFFVLGRSTPTGKFFPSHVLLASHEDTRAWETSYHFVKILQSRSIEWEMVLKRSPMLVKLCLAMMGSG